MKTLGRLVIAVLVNMIVCFLITLIVVTSMADESNGMYGVNAMGVGLIIAIPVSALIGIPCGVVVGLWAPRVVHSISKMIAVAAVTALVIIFTWGILLLSENTGSDRFLGSVPFMASIAFAFLSNMVTLFVSKRILLTTSPKLNQ